jgi:hypothetical protein
MSASLFYAKVTGRKGGKMDTLTRQTIMGFLFAIGAGVALAVSLDSIAIGIGVGFLFGAGFILRRKKEEQS